MKIISKTDADYTAVLAVNHLKCYLNGTLISHLAVRNKAEAQAIIDYWSTRKCALYDAQRFYDLSQAHPEVKMDDMYFSPSRRSILYRGSVLTYDV